MQARQILCLTCQSPVAGQTRIRMLLEDVVKQQCNRGSLVCEEPAIRCWTLTALLDAAMMVRSCAWIQLHETLVETAVDDESTGTFVFSTVCFSHLMRKSLTCTFPVTLSYEVPCSPFPR